MTCPPRINPKDCNVIAEWLPGQVLQLPPEERSRSVYVDSSVNVPPWAVLQLGHVPWRSLRKGPSWIWPHSEQVLLDRYKRSVLTNDWFKVQFPGIQCRCRGGPVPVKKPQGQLHPALQGQKPRSV
jgi:hypothetical protein